MDQNCQMLSETSIHVRVAFDGVTATQASYPHRAAALRNWPDSRMLSETDIHLRLVFQDQRCGVVASL